MTPSTRGIALLLLALSLPAYGDTFNLIQGVNVVQPIAMGTMPVTIVVNGSGKCREMEIDWGDMSKDTQQYVDLASHPTFKHSFAGGGGKTVTITAKTGCEGKVRTRFVVEPSVFRLGFAQVQKPTATTCRQVPNIQTVSPNTLVRITTLPATGVTGINFGCPFGCWYDADGRSGSTADSRFPFPGFREYSLVLKVGLDKFQGGTNTTFVAKRSGLLEVCLNDFDMTNNSGGYQINIRQDQLGP